LDTGRPKSDKKEIQIRDINWILGEAPDLNNKYQARIRYRQPLQSCKIYKSKASVDFKVVFDEIQKSVSSGQSLVLYDGDICIAGGVIN